VFGSFASTLSTFLSDVDVAIVVNQQQRRSNTITADNRHKRRKADSPSEEHSLERSSERSSERSVGGRFFSDTPLQRTGLDCIEAWQSGISDSDSSSSSSSDDSSSGADSGSDSEGEECNAKSSNAKSSNAKSSDADGALASTTRYATPLFTMLFTCAIYECNRSLLHDVVATE
jgi:hypothetical protein